MKNILYSLILSCIALSETFADEAKFNVEGDTLFYNTETTEARRDYVAYEDATTFRKLLSAHPEITRVELYSNGGKAKAGLEIGRILRDFNITTIVREECSSACISIFLAGSRREISPGALLGFHRPEWSVDTLEAFYNGSKDEEGWGSPFTFASWVQQDSFYLAGRIFEEYLDAGVDFVFAKRALSSPYSNLWYPSRQELENSGVITRQASLISSIAPRLRPENRTDNQGDIIRLTQAN